MSDEQLSKELFLTAASYWKGQAPCFIDVKNENGIFDFMLLVTSQSQRHSKTLGQQFRALFKHLYQRHPQVYGTEEGNWILIDHQGLCVQILVKDMRESLDFEGLFSESQQVFWTEDLYQKHLPKYQSLLDCFA